MLCSQCSAPVRPVVAIDIDGTLGDYHRHLHIFAEQWLGRAWSGPSYDGVEEYWRWFTRTFGCDRTTFRQIKLAFRQGGWKRTMPVYSGARRMIAALRDDGVEVWLTTTRPWERFDRVDPDTREWLRRNNIEFDGLLFHDDKMNELADRVSAPRVVAVLDDQEDILLEAGRKGWTPILRKNHYNRGVAWSGKYVTDLGPAYYVIAEAVEEWRRTNG